MWAEGRSRWVDLRLPTPLQLPSRHPSPPTSNNKSLTRRGRKKTHIPKPETQKGHRTPYGLSVLGMTWILVPEQVRKAPKPAILYIKFLGSCYYKSSSLFLSPRNNTINATAVNHGRQFQGYARSDLETQDLWVRCWWQGGWQMWMERAWNLQAAVTGRSGLKEGMRLKEKSRMKEDEGIQQQNVLRFYYRNVHEFKDTQQKRSKFTIKITDPCNMTQ